MKVTIDLPQHTEPGHAVTVYIGCREQFKQVASREARTMEIDLPDYDGDDARFVHAPVNASGFSKSEDFRSVCRADGNWHPFKLSDADWFGLPPLKITSAPRKLVSRKETNKQEAACHLDDCECADD